MRPSLNGPAAPLLAAAALAGVFGWHILSVVTGPERLACDALTAAERPPVVVYGTSWCQFCKKTRWFLEDHEVAYCEYDIEESQAGAAQYHQLDGGPIPLILIGPRRLEGFDREALTAALHEEGLLP